ncbi:hypothetical protein UFOVP657_75 [uncultured Caudovirales phage]|uniref:Uncharacterized protein n=1 Tax=uncultured Caudovirales phage TaxID=2100421 RepID=A0A6J5MIP9_9CAUD|nr:hypothetical protein UFOVP467_36 [uncultured Caudovirales phage]CAB4156592.1 hypothetical protein UFOVP657_75 [uncultured Caudovirales phage]
MPQDREDLRRPVLPDPYSDFYTKRGRRTKLDDIMAPHEPMITAKNGMKYKIGDSRTYFKQGDYDVSYQRASGYDPVMEFRENTSKDNAANMKKYDDMIAREKAGEMDHRRRTDAAMDKAGATRYAKENTFGASALGGNNGAYPNQGPMSKAMKVKNTKPGM